MFERLQAKGFQVLYLHHAEAILRHDMPEAAQEIESVLDSVSLPVDELVRDGGGEGQLTQRIRNTFSDDFGWKKHNFEMKKIIDGHEKESISHEIDHVKFFKKGTFAMEIEWNNKDPFFDRDLENFKRLHADGAISVGCIITRGASLQSALTEVLKELAEKRGFQSIKDLAEYNYNPTPRQVRNIENEIRNIGFAEGWAKTFVRDKFGEATTHWRKLEDRVRRGVGNPCPLLLIGIPRSVIKF